MQAKLKAPIPRFQSACLLSAMWAKWPASFSNWSQLQGLEIQEESIWMKANENVEKYDKSKVRDS